MTRVGEENEENHAAVPEEQRPAEPSSLFE